MLFHLTLYPSNSFCLLSPLSLHAPPSFPVFLRSLSLLTNLNFFPSSPAFLLYTIRCSHPRRFSVLPQFSLTLHSLSPISVSPSAAPLSPNSFGFPSPLSPKSLLLFLFLYPKSSPYFSLYIDSCVFLWYSICIVILGLDPRMTGTKRTFINHSGHYACHRKERATRKLWYIVDRRPGHLLPHPLGAFALGGDRK